MATTPSDNNGVREQQDIKHPHDIVVPSTTSAPPATAQTPEHIREQAFLKYTMDVQRQNTSGPWEITVEQKELNRKTQAMLMDIFPFPDIHKHSDCDLIYRFLIAKKWDVKLAADGIRAYIAFRKKLDLNNVLWDPFPDELESVIRFHTIDNEGRPVYLWRPNPKFISEVLEKHPRELIVRHYMKVIEQGRRISLGQNVDRMCCLMDLSLLGLSALRNLTAMGIMKEITQTLTTHFPENLRFQLVINGGFSFTGVMAVINPFLDDRVRKKVVNLGSGDKAKAELGKYLNLKNVPASFLGDGPEIGPHFRALSELPRSPKGAPPGWPLGSYRGELTFDHEGNAAPLVAAAAPAHAHAHAHAPAPAAAAAAATAANTSHSGHHEQPQQNNTVAKAGQHG